MRSAMGVLSPPSSARSGGHLSHRARVGQHGRGGIANAAGLRRGLLAMMLGLAVLLVVLSHSKISIVHKAYRPIIVAANYEYHSKFDGDDKAVEVEPRPGAVVDSASWRWGEDASAFAEAAVAAVPEKNKPAIKATISMYERLRMIEAVDSGPAVFKERIGGMRDALVSCTPTNTSDGLACSGGCVPPDAEAVRLSGLRDKRLFIAFNLHSNEALMPHFVSELLSFLLLVKPSQVFVSAYESGSKDLTSLWMEYLDLLLEAYGIPHRILDGDFHMKLRAKKDHRIRFLAAMRNKVLEPLPVFASPDDEDASSGLGDHVLMSATSDHAFGNNNTGTDVFPSEEDLALAPRDEQGRLVRFDQVVFLNDVYFCARDILALMQHDAHLACGMDFYPPQKRHRNPCLRTNAGFYDVWVARDIRGRRMTECPPYFVGFPEAAEGFGRGVPVPVQCCWNGMVVLDAEPFHRGLRFRYAPVKLAIQRFYLKQGRGAERPSDAGLECTASECSLLCKDLWNSNYTDIIMDPAVKVAYQENYPWFKNRRHEAWPRVDDGAVDAARAEWTQRRRSKDDIGPELAMSFGPPPEVECCPMKSLGGFVGDILRGHAGVCYNETTSLPSYLAQTPQLIPKS